MAAVVEIRPTGVEDAQALARLNQAFNGVVEPPDRLAVRLADPGCVDFPILAEINGAAVGFACLRILPCVFYPEPYAELTELYVEPEWRRGGVGTALVAFAEAVATERGVREMVLLTGAHNEAAQLFYRSIGYSQTQLALKKFLP